ncbi:venom acid phosphatase Acph-1-like isoform X3 [Phymastichus coffea]|uniref:venom acid phosphatase Acph-1-like isoform X3 n=1 Tax=Phymastichus coffea TaxID=108790 RepID=UPI00273BD3ED|nr:venom acid phosphatase Acph-1-like isoform X3 [Phymastichus coffea]
MFKVVSNTLQIIHSCSKMKLELVQLFRHGARTPIKEELKIFSYIDESSYEPLGLGTLTNTGKKQMYELGKFLRERYSEFLGANYKSDHVYAYSSDTDRTKMSLQLVLAGLYPPIDQEVWNPHLMWSPVPYVYTPRQFDVLLRSYDNKKFRNFIRNSYLSKDTKKRITKNSDFLSEKTGINFSNNFYNIAFVYGVLIANECMNLPLPDWYTADVKETFIESMAQVYDGYVSTLEMRKIGVGPLIKMFIQNMNLDRTVFNPRKIYLYSGHDGNLAMFTRVHGIKEFRYPEFGSALIFEKLRDSEDNVHVKILSWTGNGKLMSLPLGDHSEFCPIDNYLRMVESIIPTDKEIEKMINDSKCKIFRQLFFSDNAVKKL